MVPRGRQGVDGDQRSLATRGSAPSRMTGMGGGAAERPPMFHVTIPSSLCGSSRYIASTPRGCATGTMMVPDGSDAAGCDCQRGPARDVPGAAVETRVVRAVLQHVDVEDANVVRADPLHAAQAVQQRQLVVGLVPVTRRPHHVQRQRVLRPQRQAHPRAELNVDPVRRVHRLGVIQGVELGDHRHRARAEVQHHPVSQCIPAVGKRG